MRSLVFLSLIACSSSSLAPTVKAPSGALLPNPTTGPSSKVSAAGLPVARTVPAVDRQFGLEVPDPYRWMEGAENQELTAWLRAHGEHAARELAKIRGDGSVSARATQHRYPAVIFTTGLNDHRVAPWMTAKMAARLLASTTSGKPILVRVDAEAGHGIGSTQDQYYAQRADLWSFFLQAFGEPGFAASK
jgi:protease II